MSRYQRNPGWAKLERPVCLTKQVKHRHILYTLGCFFILFVLTGFQLPGQVALPVAVKFRFVPILAQHAGNVGFVQLIVRNNSPLAERWQQCGEQ